MDYSALLDGFSLCEKRTANTMKATHELGSYLGKFAQSVKEGTKGIPVVKQYASKKLSINPGFDYTLKTSVDSAATELEEFLNTHTTFSTQVIELSADIERFYKEQELVRKKLVDSAHRLERDYSNQLDVLKKAKDKYHKLGQELDAITAQIEKVKGQMNVQKVVQLTSKQAKALDSFKQAEAEYQSTLEETNKYKERYYNEDMPALLREFNAFEETRISFLKEKLVKLSEEILALPQKIEDSGNRIKNAANSINSSDDIKNFVSSNQTSYSLSPIPSEPYTPVGSGEKTDSAKDSSHESSSPKPQIPLRSSSSSSSVPPPASNDSTSAPPPRAQPSIPMAGMVPTASSSSAPHRPQPQPPAASSSSSSPPSSIPPPAPNSSSASSPASPSIPPRPSRGSPHPSGPARPPPTRKTDSPVTPRAPAQRPPATRPATSRPVPSPEQQPQQVDNADDNQEEECLDIEEQTPVCQKKGLYKYSARSETELGFDEGEVLDILKQNDSGWWLARIGDKTGYVPMNYLTDV